GGGAGADPLCAGAAKGALARTRRPGPVRASGLDPASNDRAASSGGALAVSGPGQGRAATARAVAGGAGWPRARRSGARAGRLGGTQRGRSRDARLGLAWLAGGPSAHAAG